MLTRRSLLGWAAGTALAGSAHWAAAAGRSAYEVRDLAVEGSRRVGRRFTLLIPRHLKAGQQVPLLVALHGLGETGDERAGAYAWLERYGLGSCYERLVQGPIAQVGKHRYWPEGRLDEVNRLLQAKPFRGLAVACPYTPNVYKARSRKATLDEYADWLVDVVVPRARSEAPVYRDPALTFLDGCSLGGYVGMEVFLRKAQHFGAWGSLQGALGQHRITGYADRLVETLAQVGPRPIRLGTSDQDVFHDLNQQMSKLLTKRGLPHTLHVGRGPHNQPWLREAGSLEMLLWHDRLSR